MVDQALQAVQDNSKLSVREYWPGVYGGVLGDGVGLFYPGMADIVPAYGTYACDWKLRLIHYMQHNTLWSGAHDIWIQKFLSTPYEISGGRNQTYTWQDIFFESDFGEGYDFMMSKALSDYLVLNRGMFIEKVAYGDTETPLPDGTRIVALNHLDALRIYFTGNLEVPYIYNSEITGQWHKLHRTRVIHLANMPSSNTRLYGMGRSSLYSALSQVNSQILLGKHQNELLSDMPPPGLIVFQNIKGEDIDLAMSMFEAERRRDGESVYRAPMRIEGLRPDQPVTVTFTPLAQVPEGFDFEKYQNQHVYMLALALGLDPQDIWPLTSGGPLGTATQSKELSAKTEVKGPGYLLTRLEREWNRVTPRPLEWKYKAQNAQQDKSQADLAAVWMNQVVVPGVKEGILTEDEGRQLLANQVDQYADVLLDEQGDLIRLPDDDPKEPGWTGPNPPPYAVAAGLTPAPAATPTNPNITNPENNVQADDTTQFSKDYTDTVSAFTDDVGVIFADAQNGDVSKSQFRARLRSSINQYGKAAYMDGLETGGLTEADYDETDSSNFADILAEQSQYVSGVVDKFFNVEGGFIGDVSKKADLWQSTLNNFYYKGVESADKNGLYTFKGDDGKENCSTCYSLKDQTHRMSWWANHELRPGVDHHNFECGTWPGNCEHYLEKK